MFIGVMTNLLFGAAIAVAGGRRSWAWADDVIFYLLNLGLVAFLAVLLFAGYDSELVRVTAPVMGVGALLGIATFSLRLSSAAVSAARPLTAGGR